MSNRIVGIDLGTSTSEIAILENGKPKLIANHLGEFITPSVVGVSDDGRIIVGQEAKDQLLLKPDETVFEVKRLMGQATQVKMGENSYSPSQIAAYILRYLIDSASHYLGEEISRAVITVPAYFSDEQRRATVTAGELAGIKVERILNEPTAAALDYGLEHLTECQNILIYDLGGGTLDVTVLEMFEGVLDVKASCGNNQLGGKDFDQSLINYLRSNFESTHQIDLSQDKRALLRLKEAAETAKITLSSETTAQISLPFFAKVKQEPVALETTITRELFETLIQEKIDSTAAQINSALNDAKLTAAEIELILLVGGSTRIPYVQTFIEKTLGKSAAKLVDPDLAVVRGAAIQAGILNNELSSEHEIMITDVCPYTLGTSVLEYINGFPAPDVYNVLIPRNVTIPVVRERVYSTAADGQTAAEIKIYQGEYRTASDNNFLGKFMLDGIPPAPAGKEEIKILFSYDVNGILQVEGEILSLNKKAGLTIETTGVKMVQEVDLEGWEETEHARKYKAVIKKALRLIEHGNAGSYAPEMESLVQQLQKGLITGAAVAELDELKEELNELIYEAEEAEEDDV